MTDSSSNPFSPPGAYDVTPLPTQIDDLDFKGLKSLYLVSRNLRALAVIYILFGIGLMVGAGLAYNTAMIILLPFGLGFLLAGIGYMKRTGWGNILGLVVACFYLVGFVFSLASGRPGLLGLIFGVVGVQIFVKGKRLFGVDRVTHQELKDAYQRSKR